MTSKSKFVGSLPKYQWHIFVPLAVVMWVVIIVSGLWIVESEREFRISHAIVEAEGSPKGLYIMMITLAAGGTLVAFLMSRKLSRSISNLRDFAIRASRNAEFVPTDKFSDDEIGEISRQIVQIYNERHEATQRLNHDHEVAMRALEEKNQLKHELTNNINHHLKTPVSVIKGYIDTILEHPDMDEAQRLRFLKKIGEHADRLTQMLNDVSSLTRLEFGSQMIHTEPINFHEMVFQLANVYTTTGILGTIRFNYDIPAYCRVIGNLMLLQTVINNLTKNSAAYSKGTDCNLILTDTDDKFYHFAFYDNGVGVKEENIPLMFERFFREDTRGNRKSGTGLGLPIVQNSIEALGGTISVANRDGGGLIFRFTLRRAK